MTDNAVKGVPRGFIYHLDQNGNITDNRSRIRQNADIIKDQESFREALKNAEVLNLLDVIRQKEAEAAENPDPDLGLNFADNVVIVDFDKFNEDFSRPGSTGDPVMDKLNEILYNYYESCFDTANASEFYILSRNMDLTGMTNAEKYKAIYEKYQYCFGENFLEAEAVRYWARSSDNDPYWRIYLNFCNEVEKACGSKSAAQKARIEALYGSGLRSDQVRQKIIDKYYYEGMTLRDMLKMTHEMWLCGLDGGVSNIVYDITMDEIPRGLDHKYTDVKTRFINREKILDEEVSPKLLREVYALYQSRKATGITVHPELGEVIGDLLGLFKADAIEGAVSADNDIFAHVWDKFK